MRVIIKYKARLTWTEDGKFHNDIPCNVIHEVQLESDGSWKTVNLDWLSLSEPPQ